MWLFARSTTPVYAPFQALVVPARPRAPSPDLPFDLFLHTVTNPSSTLACQATLSR